MAGSFRGLAPIAALGLIAGTTLCVVAALSAPPHALDSLVQAERSFSATSVARGMRDAFLAFLADDGMLFRPFAVNGKKVWEARKPSPATLIWEPGFAEVSADGRMGVTTGPWEFRPPADSTGTVAADQVGHGHFITVWERPAGGEWRVAADMGISHDKPDSGGLGTGLDATGPNHVAAFKPGKGSSGIEDAERGFSKDSQTNGVVRAMERWATADVRWNREGDRPALGRIEARTLSAKDSGLVRWTPHFHRAAGSADLGYAYGVAERFASRGAKVPADSSAYLHVWRRDGNRWRMSLAVVNPIRR